MPQHRRQADADIAFWIAGQFGDSAEQFRLVTVAGGGDGGLAQHRGFRAEQTDQGRRGHVRRLQGSLELLDALAVAAACLLDELVEVVGHNGYDSGRNVKRGARSAKREA